MALLSSIPIEPLKKYLDENFPDAHRDGESPIDTAIRLLGEYKTIKEGGEE